MNNQHIERVERLQIFLKIFLYGTKNPFRNNARKTICIHIYIHLCICVHFGVSELYVRPLLRDATPTGVLGHPPSWKYRSFNPIECEVCNFQLNTNYKYIIHILIRI